jgi:hypothetical protein
MAAKRDIVTPVTIMITRGERDLIMRYGYPFEDIERQLKEAGEVDLIRVTDAPYWWEQLINNLHISEKENYTDEQLLTELRALLDRVADALGML